MVQKNILISPLSWGLGHAGRMIPVALKLRAQGHIVYIAGDKACLALFAVEAPEITPLFFPGFIMRYSVWLPGFLAVITKIPSIIFHSIRDHKKLKKLVKENEIDIVISDNRFGCWNRSIKSVYITHQLRIIFPSPFRFLEPVGIALHRLIINKYDNCLVPDLPGEINLSGDLSHNLGLSDNTKYIGLVSRFLLQSENEKSTVSKNPYDCIILSGPEPQKGILRQKLLNSLGKGDKNIIIFEGRPGLGDNNQVTGKILSINHAGTENMSEIIVHSERIVTRSGYTTIMELISLNCTALLIPTPGQTEQEYLAGYLEKKGWFTTSTQNKSDFIIAPFNERQTFPQSLLTEGEKLLNNALKEISE